MKVTCEQCGHPAEIAAESATWKCNCAVGVSVDPDCACDHTNEIEDAEPNPPDNAGEIAELEARIAALKLEGGVKPEGDVQHD